MIAGTLALVHLNQHPCADNSNLLTMSARICCTACPTRSFTVRVPIWSLDLISYGLFKDFLPSTSWDHGGGKWNFGANFPPLLVKENVLESSRPFALISSSGAGTVSHLDLLQGHFWRSFDWRHQPQSCTGRSSHKSITMTSRPRQRHGLSLNPFDRE